MTFSGLQPDAVPALMTGGILANPTEKGRADAYLPSPCIQNHAANLAFLPDGTLTCVWFGGTMEGMGDISIYMSRLFPGATRWSAPEKMSDDPVKSEQNPLIFNAPGGDVWLLYTSQTSGNQDGSVVKCRISADGGKTFGEVSVLCDLPGTFVRQPIIVNGRGAWLLPVFRCIGLLGERWTGDADTAGVLISRDQGKSWVMTAVPDSLGAVHMNIVALEGDDLVAFYRNRFAQSVLASRSTDGGESWSAPQPMDLPNNNSSIQAVKLKSCVIAIVYNHSNALMSDARRQSLYDEIEGGEAIDAAPLQTLERRKAVWGVPRAPLSLAFSSDGGTSFSRRIDLDTGDGYCLSNNSKDSLNREFSYPSIVQGADGVVHIAYTYYRRAIKYVRLSPEAIG
ncbi:sialidase family protein [Rhizobium rhizogenes]|uniref:Glycosyl hydrolase protein n=1 Tax=Rhizobium rhizogenes (strain K84 / ATCC BAA-868) TaxID=311403 RepID=B9JJ87_RHIR8|nr:exo-alpha-sialidase [Rhizobium rhizogenes]ACM29979.1 glycosyl hydrolase protein [Rhizobium rhizogenes K84]OCJ10801.1 glycosyl hydrolase [Agrobacterium sp. B131/95]MDJ1636630.1 exo-alpha-sialidase [Rhizobium rhizogenes]NTG76900.1 glycosyl hydrolase [Rhizobium rhizogenes]NTH15530.1 glycosyl hydrolase [Rhizobium rhizogenes]